VVVYLVDGTTGMTAEDDQILAELGWDGDGPTSTASRLIPVWNKIDVPGCKEPPPVSGGSPFSRVSATTMEGVDALVERIVAEIGPEQPERSGAPVRQGEMLFRIARWDVMRVQATVDERDIDYVEPGAEVKLIFASRPNSPTPARVLRVDPMAFTEDGANLFVVHCEIEEEGDAWWRPGMSGTARVAAGKRAPIWLLTRRTLDYFRLRWGW
jgi:hypothetical protein